MDVISTDEFGSVGLSVHGMDSSGNVSWSGTPNKELTTLVIAAHGKVSTAPEVIALRDYLKSDARWDAYVACRKAVIQQARQARYREETDALRLKADEDYTIGSEDWLTAIEAWKTAKNTIRAALPYEVE